MRLKNPCAATCASHSRVLNSKHRHGPETPASTQEKDFKNTVNNESILRRIASGLSTKSVHCRKLSSHRRHKWQQNRHCELVPSTGEMLKVPGRKPNKEQRTKEYLTEAEVGRLMKAARKGRWGHRDATLVLVMVRHGLRVTEACDLRWDQIDWSKGHLHVKRLKGGIDSVHTLQGDELRALHQLEREQEPKSAFVFTSERGGPMSCFNVNKLISKAGKRSGDSELSPAHASPRLRPSLGRCRARHATPTALAGSFRYQTHRTLFGTERKAVQGFLARLMPENGTDQFGGRAMKRGIIDWF